MLGVEFLPSCNHGPRMGGDPEWIVLHYDGGSDGRRVAEWLCKSEARRSPHFCVLRGGEILQLVLLDRAAWHAGASEWWSRGEMHRNVNRFSIGIELANLGYLYRSRSGRFWYENSGTMYPYRGPDPEHATLTYDTGQERSGWWEPYPDEQIKGLRRLLGKLHDAGYPIRITGHESIGMPMGRKQDPGPLLPWGRLGNTLVEIRTTAKRNDRPE